MKVLHGPSSTAAARRCWCARRSPGGRCSSAHSGSPGTAPGSPPPSPRPLLALACTLAPPPLRPALAFLVVLLLGLFGNDLRRWSLGLHRFHLAHVVAARDPEEAFLRLHTHRPDLLGFSA